MSSVNKVILIGNLGRDPDMHYATNGNAICNVSLATTRSRKDKATGDKIEDTEWHRVVMYDRLAEVAGEYLKKGRSVYVEGRLKTRKWQDKEGKDHYTTEVIAEVMNMLGGREGGEQEPFRGSEAKQAPSAKASRPVPQVKTGTGFDDMEDDIPF